MDPKLITSVDNYSDFKGLNELHYQVSSNPELAKKEVSEQFESLLVQMLMKSMRDANQPLASDSSVEDQSALYHDLFDKQLSLVVSHSGTGLAKVIEESLGKSQAMALINTLNDEQQSQNALVDHKNNHILGMTDTIEKTQENSMQQPLNEKHFESSSEFVKTLWASAQEAASILGTDPKFLLAQAALETNWGKSILSMETGESTHNLFNIKADKSWNAPSTQINAIEYEDGVMVKQKSSFRAYDSFKDSFTDYVHFLKNNSRYEEALKSASDPKQFAQALQKASYATDAQYSDKIMQIYSSKRLNDLIVELNLPSSPERLNELHIAQLLSCTNGY